MRQRRLSSSRVWGILLPGLMLLMGCATSRAPTPSPVSPSEGIYHTVRPGETLATIARTYGSSWQVLAQVNRLPDPNRIDVGQSIWIPFKPGRERDLPAPPTTAARFPPKGALRWPAEGVLRSGFGQRNGRFHNGIDVSGPQGTPIMAAADGVVIFSGRSPHGYGNTMMLEHTGGMLTMYAHNDRHAVRVGERVRRGQIIAWMGETGRSWGTHLHFEVHHQGRPVNPLLWLP